MGVHRRWFGTPSRHRVLGRQKECSVGTMRGAMRPRGVEKHWQTMGRLELSRLRSWLCLFSVLPNTPQVFLD